MLQTLQRLADSKKFSMEKVTSKYNESNTLYLCPGHHASMRVEEGITEVLTLSPLAVNFEDR